MKRTLAGAALGAVAIGCLAAQGHAEPREDLRDFMRAKLKHSQNVLEGLVLADYDKIAKGAQEMSLLSLAATWQVLQTPEYLDYSRKFRVEADALTNAAKQGKLDAATQAYNKMTVRCVECHKYVRDVKMARLD
jgi:cytochrome c556